MLCLLSLLLGLTALQTEDSKYKIPLLTCWGCQGSFPFPSERPACLCENAFSTGELQLCKSESTPALPPSPVKTHFGCEGLDHSS